MLDPGGRLLSRSDPVLLGVVHLPPLPGSPGFSRDGMGPVLEAAQRDSERLLEAGLDGYIIENFGDAPFFKGAVPAHTVAAMTRVATLLARSDAIVGVNVLRNDVQSALAIATVTDLDFVRVNVHVGAMVTDQGLIEGNAAQTLRLRESLGSRVRIAADVDVKHARPLAAGFDRGEAARETYERGQADILIVSGVATGAPVRREELEQVSRAAPETPVWIGSGATAESARDLLTMAHGIIVGSSIKENGLVREPVDLDRARRFVDAARSA